MHMSVRHAALFECVYEFAAPNGQTADSFYLLSYLISHFSNMAWLHCY